MYFGKVMSRESGHTVKEWSDRISRMSETEQPDSSSSSLSLEDLPQPSFEGEVSIETLSVDGDNPNTMSDELFSVLVDRMRTRGWIAGPIITTTDGMIVDGEHRWRAADDIGLTEVPVKQFELTDGERRLLRQELNKIRGEHDSDRDESEFERIIETQHDEELTDLLDSRNEFDDIEHLIDTETPDFEPVEETEQPDLDDVNHVECPDCGHEFNPGDFNDGR